LVSEAWGQPVDVDKVAAALQAHQDAAVLAFVHAETSTGVRSDAEALCRLATENNCLSIVDTVTSLGGIELRVDAWGADAVYSGTQKCLSCPPGLSPITLSDRAVAAIQSRNAPIQSWFQDLTLVMGYWGGETNAPRSYHHTAPVNALYGLHESLVMLAEEGLENAWQRHADQHVALRNGVQALGMEFLVDEAYRLPQLNSICVPDGVDEAALRQCLLDEHNLEIGAGLGELAGKVWRVGLMGASAVTPKVNLFLGAMREALAG
jgi:alanine-glyoxylate transaminase/serine-glyoxylate transaminase/serine-pyruvate transaminase